MAKSPSYHLTDQDKGFESRSKKIFDDVDKITNNLALNKGDIKPVRPKRRAVADDKVPIITEKPAFETNPKQWTKYDLSDTNAGDDRQNTQTAFNFLHDLRKRRKSEEKHSPVKTEIASMETESTPKAEAGFGKSPVYKMKEHVVGMTAKPRRKITADNMSCDKVDLDHLENISAAEFKAEMEMKLNDTLKLANLPKPDTSGFKNVHNKSKRNVRSRKHDDSDDEGGSENK